MTRIVSFFGDRSPVFAELNERARQYAAGLGLDYEWAVQDPYDRDLVVQALRTADVGIIDVQPFGEEMFSQVGERLQLLVRFGVGYDNVDLTAAGRHGVAVARTTGANTWGVAEMALTLILAGRRRVLELTAGVASGQWTRRVAGETVQSTVGIVGFGSIGRALATLLTGFGTTVLVHDPVVPDEAVRAAGAVPVALDDLLASSDAVSLHVPYGPATHHLIDAKRLGLMKPDAVLVNTSRGGVVDEDALADALAGGRLGAAGLDVFETEPLPLDSPLVGLPNAVLTPHSSSQTLQSLWRIYAMAIEIAADVTGGAGSPHVLNADALAGR
ncbi:MULTISPECIES: NAD(P)-dependent oxidoreductase [unclassified Modestobacter]